MKDPKLCTNDGCKGVAVGAIVSKTLNAFIVIRYCEQHKPFGIASEFWEFVSVERSVIFEVMGL